MRLGLLVIFGCTCLLACGGDDDADPVPDAADHDADSADTGMSPHDAGADAADDGGSDAAAPMLPPCSLVCDRVIDCASATCIGIDWQTAGVAQRLCDDACGPQLNAQVMAAADCAGVMSIVQTAAPTIDMLCNDPPCVSACHQFALCTKQECERYASQTVEDIAMGCMGWCEDDSAGDILNISCEALIDALDQNDPNFAAGCHGSMGCADMTACTAYATKTTGCMLEHCDASAADYEMGIHRVLLDYCATADDCPAPEAIALVNDASVTCDDPPLDATGPAAPFTLICAGTVGADHADLLTACDTLIACGAAFASNQLCAAYLGFEPGAGTKATCIEMAADCTGAFTCL
jgi:hypothetical protein